MRAIQVFQASLQHWLIGAVALGSVISMVAQDAPPPPKPGVARPRAEAASRGNPEKLSQLREKLQDLIAAGKMNDAAQVKAEIAELSRPRPGPARRPAPNRGQNEMGRLEQQLQELRSRLDSSHPPMGPREDLRTPPPGPVERMRHVQIAIEHLHAAGMHRAADRLQRVSERLRPPPGNPRGPDARPGEEIERTLQDLKNQLQELRQGMRQLKQRLEEVAQDRR